MQTDCPGFPGSLFLLIAFSALQDANAISPMLATLSGIVTDVSASQLKTLSPKCL